MDTDDSRISFAVYTFCNVVEIRFSPKKIIIKQINILWSNSDAFFTKLLTRPNTSLPANPNESNGNGEKQAP